MFILFSTNKTNYQSGQIFPFLIALICVVIIMIMIAVNLGQIAIYRTDVSNAADAGALAGASVFSAQLLSYGLQSDYMCGSNLIKAVAIIVAILTITPPWNIISAISIFVTIISNNESARRKALADSRMGWTRARKTALQYAFMNAGVDEPKPTYEEFLAAIGESATAANYDEYLKVDTDRARAFLRTGFDKFMESSKNGYWITNRFGDVYDPSAVSISEVVNGYGWQRDSETGKITNSFEDNPSNQQACWDSYCWRNYDNFVEVKVKSRSQDKFHLVGLADMDTVGWLIFGIVFLIRVKWWVERLSELGPLGYLLAAIFALVEATLAKVLVQSINFGLAFTKNGSKDGEYIANSTVDVTVSRYKKSYNTGLWNFRYSGGRFKPIQAFASGHCYKSGDETIGPTFLTGELWTFFFGGILGYLIMNWNELFDTKKHLFDSKLKETK